jgi:hypothetical protein
MVVHYYSVSLSQKESVGRRTFVGRCVCSSPGADFNIDQSIRFNLHAKLLSTTSNEQEKLLWRFRNGSVCSSEVAMYVISN